MPVAETDWLADPETDADSETVGETESVAEVEPDELSVEEIVPLTLPEPLIV